MPRYFTHYWAAPTWKKHAADHRPLIHTAGSQFHEHGVRPGDVLYIITYNSGDMLVAGKLVVRELTTKEGALAFFKGKPVWDAPEHILADPKQSSKNWDFSRRCSRKITSKILFHSPEGPKPPKLVGDGALNTQTLRGVRELTIDSAKLLDALLG